MSTSSFGYFPIYSGVTANGLAPVGYQPSFNSFTTIAVAGAQVLTAAQTIGGFILHDPSGGDANLTTPTAAELVAAMKGAVVGTVINLNVRNTADAAETITLVGGTDVTISGTATIGQNNTKLFRLAVTNITPGSEALTAYSMGTLVF